MIDSLFLVYPSKLNFTGEDAIIVDWEDKVEHVSGGQDIIDI